MTSSDEWGEDGGEWRDTGGPVMWRRGALPRLDGEKADLLIGTPSTDVALHFMQEIEIVPKGNPFDPFCPSESRRPERNWPTRID
jgi:hypothetical protein